MIEMYIIIMSISFFEMLDFLLNTWNKYWSSLIVRFFLCLFVDSWASLSNSLEKTYIVCPDQHTIQIYIKYKHMLVMRLPKLFNVNCLKMMFHDMDTTQRTRGGINHKQTRPIRYVYAGSRTSERAHKYANEKDR